MVNFGVPLSSTTFSRVSSALPGNVVLGNLRRNHEILLRIQEQLSSGMAINRPSDDPVGANRILGFNSQIARNEQFLRNLQSAHGRLAMSEQSMVAAEEVVIRAREIFLTQRNSPSDATSRAQAANEVDFLLRDLLSQANARFEGRQLFGGSRTAGAPFTFLGTDVVFRGDLDMLLAEVADGLRSPTNVPASAFGAFSDGIRGLDFTSFQAIDLNPAVTTNTRLADLYRGRGIELGSIEVTGTAVATVDLSAAKTVGDVIDLISASGVGVTASVNGANDGLLLAGAAGTITVQEVSNGRTAQDLGILATGVANPPGLTGSDLDPLLTAATNVDDLFAGAGLPDSSGFVVTNQSASQTLTTTIDSAFLTGSPTIEQLLNRINASDAQVEARINADGTAIDIHSRLSGAFLTVTENGGSTASDLGLLSTVERSLLANMNSGNGIGTVAGDDLRITKKDGTQATFDLDAASTVRDVVALLQTDPDLTVVLTPADEIEITDTTGGTGPLEIHNINASFAATNLGIEGSVPGAVLTGTPLTAAGVQVDGVFTSLLRLRNALEANNEGAMDSAALDLDASEQTLNNHRGNLGSQVVSLDLTRNRVEFEASELVRLRSEFRDADIASLATEFAIQQTVLQASLATASRILETSLFNFL